MSEKSNNSEFKTVVKITGNIDTAMLSSFLEETDKIIEAYNSYRKDIAVVKTKYIQDFDRITLEISSYGGCTDCGSAMLDRIQQMREIGIHVDTHCLGMAYSMAFILFISGERRSAGTFSKFMNHATSTVSGGYLDSISTDISFFQQADSMFDTLILDNTKMTEERLSMAKLKCDWINYTEAIELGIVNEYADKPIDEEEETDKIYEAILLTIDVFSQLIERDEDESFDILCGTLNKMAEMQQQENQELEEIETTTISKENDLIGMDEL